jgi:hypothetical protein
MTVVSHNDDGTHSVIIPIFDVSRSVPECVISRTGPLDDYHWWWVHHGEGIRVVFRAADAAAKFAAS